MLSLRPYQTKAFDDVRAAYRRGIRRICLVQPTGTGKTVTGCAITQAALLKDSHALWVAHRTELIEQASEKMDDAQLDHGIIMGQHWRTKPSQVQIASVATLARRTELPPANIVVIDECHHTPAGSWKKTANHYTNSGALLLGLTATPWRLDGKGLGEFFDLIIETITVESAIADGWLVPFQVYAPANLDLSDVGTDMGDYRKADMRRAVDKPKLIGDIVGTWSKYADGRCTVVFACSVEHSLHIQAAFQAAGVTCGHVDGAMHKDDRKRVLVDLKSGAIQVCCNVDVLTEGWDLPRLSCVILARPTKSKGLWRQMIGRGGRPDKGKIDCIILDHAGCTAMHGLPTDPDEYDLRGIKKRAGVEAQSVRICESCYGANPGGTKVCMLCGAVFPVAMRSRMPDREAGELIRVEAGTRQERHYARLQREAEKEGYNQGWIDERMEAIFGGSRA